MALEENLYKKPINQRAGLPINSIQSDYVFKKRNEFSRREVGLNHPDNDSFIKLADNGDIEIMAAPGVGIIISGMNRSVSIFADTLKIYTTEDDGIRWNANYFNYAATDFTEPALVSLKDFHKSAAYHRYRDKIYKIQLAKESGNQDENVTITDGVNFGGVDISKEITLNTNLSYGSFLSEEDAKLLANDASSLNTEKIEYIKKLIYQGYSYMQAKNKAERELQ